MTMDRLMAILPGLTASYRLMAATKSRAMPVPVLTLSGFALMGVQGGAQVVNLDFVGREAIERLQQACAAALAQE